MASNEGFRVWQDRAELHAQLLNLLKQALVWLFDLNGCIVDHHWFKRFKREIWRRTAEELRGCALDEQEWEKLRGKMTGDWPALLRIVLRHVNKGASEDLLADEAAIEVLQSNTKRTLDISDVVATPGTHELLKLLYNRGRKLAVVTSGYSWYAADILNRLLVMQHFEKVVSADTMLLNGETKPSVRPWRLALAYDDDQSYLRGTPVVMVEDNPQNLLHAGRAVASPVLIAVARTTVEDTWAEIENLVASGPQHACYLERILVVKKWEGLNELLAPTL